VLLPGSKATLADLALVRAQGWDVDILAHARRGGVVVGLCGGYQMLGNRLSDPDGVEGPPADAEGLGLLDVETVIAGDKTLTEESGADTVTGAGVAGYEMHMGTTTGPGRDRPWLALDDDTKGGRAEGARSPDGRVMGSYLHGIFAADPFRHAFLAGIRGGAFEGAAFEAGVEAALDDLAAHLEKHLDLDRLLAAAEPVEFAKTRA